MTKLACLDCMTMDFISVYFILCMWLMFNRWTAKTINNYRVAAALKNIPPNFGKQMDCRFIAFPTELATRSNRIHSISKMGRLFNNLLSLRFRNKQTRLTKTLANKPTKGEWNSITHIFFFFGKNKKKMTATFAANYVLHENYFHCTQFCFVLNVFVCFIHVLFGISRCTIYHHCTANLPEKLIYDFK